MFFVVVLSDLTILVVGECGIFITFAVLFKTYETDITSV